MSPIFPTKKAAQKRLFLFYANFISRRQHSTAHLPAAHPKSLASFYAGGLVSVLRQRIKAGAGMDGDTVISGAIAGR